VVNLVGRFSREQANRRYKADKFGLQNGIERIWQRRKYHKICRI